MTNTDPISVIGEAFEALNQRDVERLLAICEPEAEFEFASFGPSGSAAGTGGGHTPEFGP
jgi:hypothetical protein